MPQIIYLKTEAVVGAYLNVIASKRESGNQKMDRVQAKNACKDTWREHIVISSGDAIMINMLRLYKVSK